MVSSLLPKSAYAEAHLEALLARLRPHTKTFKALSSEMILEVSIVIYTSVRPSLSFSKEIMQQISDLGASFDIDLYWIPEAEEEET